MYRTQERKLWIFFVAKKIVLERLRYLRTPNYFKTCRNLEQQENKYQNFILQIKNWNHTYFILIIAKK